MGSLGMRRMGRKWNRLAQQEDKERMEWEMGRKGEKGRKGR